MSQSPYFGFTLYPEGDMIFGKDLNKAIVDIEEKLQVALFEEHVQDEGVSLAVSVVGIPLTTSWLPIPMTGGREFAFARAGKITKLRAIVFNVVTPINGDIELALAEVSAPTVPITPVITFAAAIDEVVTPPVPPTFLESEEFTLIAKLPVAGAATAGVFDIQAVVEADLERQGA